MSIRGLKPHVATINWQLHGLRTWELRRPAGEIAEYLDNGVMQYCSFSGSITPLPQDSITPPVYFIELLGETPALPGASFP